MNGEGGPASHEYLRSPGAEPVAYGEGLAGRVRALAPDGVDAALDVAGSGVLPELIELAGGPEHVVTIADFGGAQEHGVRFSSGDTGRAVHALAEIGELIESGRFSLPVARTFPLAEIAAAHRVGEDGQVRGKLVLVVGPGMERETRSSLLCWPTARLCGRLLALMVPCGLEEMFLELGTLPPGSITDPAVRAAISARYDSSPA